MGPMYECFASGVGRNDAFFFLYAFARGVRFVGSELQVASCLFGFVSRWKVVARSIVAS